MTKIGIGLALGFSEEATWGTVSGTVDNFFHAFPGMEGLKRMVEPIQGDDIQSRGIDSTLINAGGRRVEGPLQADLQYGGGWLLFLAQLAGNDPVTAGAGPYTHAVSLGAALGGASDNRAKGISVFVDREGQVAGAGAKAASYSGVKPTSLEIAFAYNARARMSCDLVGKDHAGWGTRLTPSLSTRGFIISPSQAASPSAFLQYNSVDFDCREGSIRFEQELDVEGGDMQSPTMGRPEPNARTKVSGSVTVEAPESATGSGGVFFDDYESKTPRELILTLEGSNPANEKMVITVHKALVTNPGDPEVAGPGRVMHTVEFEGYYDSGNSEIAQLVLTSLDSAAWA